MLARTGRTKILNQTPDVEGIEEIRKTISECLDNAKQAYKARNYQYEKLRADRRQAKKDRHLADAVLLKGENPQQAEIHFRKAFGKSNLDWIENLKLLAAHKILHDLYGLSYRAAARVIIASRPAVAKLANENQIVQLRKHFEHLRTKNEFAREAWQCIWEEAPRDWRPIDFACYLILSIKL